MEKTQTRHSEPALKILRSGDPKTCFGQMTPAEIIEKHGLPNFLLGTSLKTKKSLGIGVLAKVLFFTPGVFCSHATEGCLEACLGHSSGRMQMPTHALARDRRTALYVEKRQLFLQMLTVEISRLEEEARRLGLVPAVRLNGSSDLPWERLHPELFKEFPNVQFFDYTKVPNENGTIPQRPDVAEELPSDVFGPAPQSRSGTQVPGPRGHGSRGVLAGSSAIALGKARHRRRQARRQIPRPGRHHRRTESKGKSKARPKRLHRKDSPRKGSGEVTEVSPGDELGSHNRHRRVSGH